MMDDKPDTPREAEFRLKCQQLLGHGQVPTPAIMGKLGFGNGRTMSGNYVTIRIEELTRFGYVYDDRARRYIKARR